MSLRSATISVPHEKLAEVMEIADAGKCECAISVTITGNTDTRRAVYQKVSKLLGDYFKPVVTEEPVPVEELADELAANPPEPSMDRIVDPLGFPHSKSAEGPPAEGAKPINPTAWAAQLDTDKMPPAGPASEKATEAPPAEPGGDLDIDPADDLPAVG